MNSVIGQCPICQDILHVTRLHCRNCDTSLEGHFSLGRLYSLTPEQLNFVEIFIRSEGKLNRVEQEIGMSYPAVRSRLREVIKALGYEVRESAEKGISDETRQAILAELNAGKITAEDALEQLRSG